MHTEQNGTTESDGWVWTSATTSVFDSPRPRWNWDVFGGGLLNIQTAVDHPLWRRVLTRLFLGSKWERLDKSP